jgi:hypothetical protein
MTNREAIGTHAAIMALVNGKSVEFIGKAKLLQLSKSIEMVSGELQDLQKIEATDKEAGIESFLEETFAFTPLALDLFKTVDNTPTSLTFKNGESEKTATESNLAIHLVNNGFIK